MDEMQALLDDLYLVCQPIMLCSHTNNSIDGYEILLRSRKLCAFPEKMFLWFIEKEERNSKLMAYYFRELKKINREPPQHQIVAESASETVAASFHVGVFGQHFFDEKKCLHRTD